MLSIFSHALLEPFTPPVPLVLCLLAAGFVIIVSFILVVVLSNHSITYTNYPTINILKWPTIRIITKPVVILAIQCASVTLFILVLLTGFVGNTDPLYNLAPTLIWVIWWVGIAYVSAFVGDVWSLLNPWRIIFLWFEGAQKWITPNRPLSPITHYPDKAGVWPALIVFLIFAWIENVYTDSIVPIRISQMILAYSLFTWLGMIIFGREPWIKHGEAFSLAFGLLARFAPIEIKYGRHKNDTTNRIRNDSDIAHIETKTESPESTTKVMNLRPFATGLLDIEVASTSKMLFLMLLLATVTFDGLTSTMLWITVQNFIKPYIANTIVINTLGLGLSNLIFITVYLSFCQLMSISGQHQYNYLNLGKIFIYTLIPIALAYHVAHFLFFLLIQGQLIIPLISDPFGYGWNLLGTIDYRLNFRLISPTTYWFISVGAIVIGHIIAIVISHNIALRIHNNPKQAIQSQYPMLALMVGYTIASLWIITQPMYMPSM